MPIYEYKCRSCAHQFETIQKFSDDLLTECPECNEHELKKLVSAAAFHLKGGGWYATDFKNGNNKERANEKPDSDKEAKSEPSEASGKSSNVTEDTDKSTDSDSKPSSSQSSTSTDVA